MNLNNLKELLYREHRRDVRLTIISLSIYAGIALLIISLLWTFAKKACLNYAQNSLQSFSQNMSWDNYYTFAIIAVMVSMVISIVYYIYRLINRKKKIDQLIEMLKQGSVAAQMAERKVYKIIIPLLKINIQLCPVTFVRVQLSGDKGKRYELPMPSELLAEIKIILSGAGEKDLEEMAQIESELWNEKTAESSATKPLPSQEEFDKFIEEELSTAVDLVEKKRTKTRTNHIVMYVMAVLAFIAVLTITLQPQLLENPLHIFGGMMILCVIYYIVMLALRKNCGGNNEDVHHHFKTQVFDKVLHFILPHTKYARHSHLPLEEVLDMGLFSDCFQYNINGNDLILGKQGGIPFKMSDITLTHLARIHQENAQPDVVCTGQLFIAKFNKKIKGDVFIIAQNATSFFSGQLDKVYVEDLGEKVHLEDPEFNKKYKVMASDQIEARYVLSTSMMERLKKIATQDAKSSYAFAIRDQRIFMLRLAADSFELNVLSTHSVKEQLQKFFVEMKMIFGIIDDLKLNQNIWQS